MTYKITGLDPANYAHLTQLTDAQLADQNIVRMAADNYPGYPCRVTLDDAQPGETLLLLNHISHHDGPYHASHAIFVTEGVGEAAHYVDQVPPALDRRLLSLRAFERGGMMADAAIVQPGEADWAIRRLLDNPAVDHIDAHNATRGCFAARIDSD